MKDRQPTKVLSNGAIRYGIYNADGTLDHYEYMKREDAPTVEGTPLNKANLLSDATAQKIWPDAKTRPADPTVNDALSKLSQGTARVGDIAMSSRTDLSDAWLLCDGRYISAEQYPELFDVLRVTASAAPWNTQSIPVYSNSHSDFNHRELSYANNHWFYATAEKLYYSDDLISWIDITPSDLSRYGDLGIVIHYYFEMHYWQGQYVCAVYLSTNDTVYPDKYMCMYSDKLQQTGWKLSYITNKSDTTPYTMTEVNRTLLFDGTTYYFDYAISASSNNQYGHSLFYTTDLTENASGEYGTAWATVSDIWEMYLAKYYDDATGYCYGFRIDSLKNYDSITGIIRTRNLQNRSNWQILDTLGVSNNIRALAVQGNDIAVLVYSYSTSKSQIYRSTDMGASFTTLLTTTAMQSKFFTDVALLSGILCAWAGNGNNWIYIFDADNIDVQIVTSDTSLYDAFAHTANVIAICSDAYTSVTYQDFTYSKKKIPNITPDSRSHAYIKALEE